MHKNIIIIVLSLTLVVVTYLYINNYYQKNTLQKQLDNHSAGAKDRIKLYTNDDNEFYYLLSDDNELWISFTYGIQGLKKNLGLVDNLSGRRFGFDFTEEGILSTFSYEDNQYTIRTNIYSYPGIHQKLIEREEWINGRGIIYDLFPDGSTEIKRLSLDDTGKIQWNINAQDGIAQSD